MEETPASWATTVVVTKPRARMVERTWKCMVAAVLRGSRLAVEVCANEEK